MKKFFVCVVIPALMTITAATTIAVAETLNKIRDGSFEQEAAGSPSNWLEILEDGAGQVRVIDSDSDSYEGDKCLEVDLTVLPTIEAVYKYVVNVIPNKFYTVGAAIRTEEATSGPATKLVVRYPADYPTKAGYEIVVIYPEAGITNWQPYNASFQVPMDTNEVEIAFVRRFVTGKAWLDFVWLQCSQPASAYLVISSTVVRRGDSFELRGINFEPLKKIALFLDDKPFAQEIEILADSKGYFEAELLMPQQIGIGRHVVQAETLDSDKTAMFEADIAVEVLPPIEPKILGIKLSGTTVDYDETLTVEMAGDTDGKIKNSEYQANFYIQGVTPEKTVEEEEEIEYERIPMTLVDAELGIYRGEFKPRPNIEVISEVTVELTGPLGQISVLESEAVVFNTVSPKNKIDSVSLNKTLVIAGEILTITLIGEPGYSAYVSLFDPASESYFASKIHLKEEATGVYKKDYEPPQGREAEGLVVIGMLGSDTKEAAETVSIDTKKPKIEVSVDQPQGYRNGEEVWIFVETDPDAEKVTVGKINEFDTTNPSVKFIRDAVRQKYFVAHFTISKRNQAPDGEKGGVIAVTDKAGNINTAELTIILKNEADIEQVEVYVPEGLHILSIPLDSGDLTLRGLAELLGEDLTMVMLTENGKFVPFVPTITSSSLFDKKIEVGVGYIVVMQKGKKITFKGKSWGATQAAPTVTSSAISAVPRVWIEPIIQVVEALPWSQSVEVTLQILYESLAKANPRTQLFQNYPNPFNPETWIPYQLADTANVVIRIYGISGELVRALHLGTKQAGFYVTKHKAAHWDGKDEQGQRVASGVYFYTIKAGTFTATRRMVIIK